MKRLLAIGLLALSTSTALAAEDFTVISGKPYRTSASSYIKVPVSVVNNTTSVHTIEIECGFYNTAGELVATAEAEIRDLAGGATGYITPLTLVSQDLSADHSACRARVYK